MTTYFISRHPGACEWARHEGITVDEVVTHLDIDRVKSGDTVAGTLPVNLAAQICAQGARYLHLTLEMPAEARGQELSAEQMRQYGARLEPFYVEKLT